MTWLKEHKKLLFKVSWLIVVAALVLVFELIAKPYVLQEWIGNDQQSTQKEIIDNKIDSVKKEFNDKEM